MTELVSILIPAYNAERWIGATIESALAQTWPAKEVIVVDDGSTDRTLAIARTFGDRGVRVVPQVNRGAAAARNSALRAARGSYIQFLDADDLLHPRKIAAQLRGAEDGRRSRVLLTCRWGRFFVRPEQARFAPDALWQDLSPADWLFTKFHDNRFMFPASWLVSRRLVDDAGPWNEDLSLDDDGEYMCRLVAASQQVRFVPDAECYYRIGNSGSLSSQRSDRAVRSGFASMHLCIERLLLLEDSERTRHACVRLLQDNLSHFYPEKADLVDQSRRLARKLGGDLTPPGERFHFMLFRGIFGWRTAKLLRSMLNDAKLRTRRWVDGLGRVDARTN
jgi:glycosyltransferase involved in cell wall biosynthesis